jgi:hypothetical protein
LKKGSVKRLPSGKWMLIYDEHRSVDGKRKQHYETVSVKTEAQARRLLGKRLDTIEAGEFEAPSKMTFGELLDHYFDARKGRLQETTLALYRRTFNQHVRPKIGDVRLDKLTRDHVERVLDTARDCSTRKRKGQPLCGRTKRNILIRVRSVLEWGSKNYEGVRNIARNVEPPLVEDREDVAFDGERVRKLLKAAKGTEIEAAVMAAIGTGCAEANCARFVGATSTSIRPCSACASPLLYSTVGLSRRLPRRKGRAVTYLCRTSL